jgi:hypothetical protein
VSATTFFKVFVDAAKETPRLYFAPIFEALKAVQSVQETMVRERKGIIRARTVDHAPPKGDGQRPDKGDDK